jgi:hypothetical protein
MTQRTWQMAAMVMAGCALAGCAAGASGPRPGPARTRMSAPPGGSPAARCGPGVLILSYGPSLSPMTGEHGVFYELVNRGRVACPLAGYPHITLYAGGDPLPFRYVFGGGPGADDPGQTVTVSPIEPAPGAASRS